jgi:ribonuclease Z
MEITFLGTSCMVPTKERNHQGIFCMHNGEGVLVDCGEGIQRQLKIAEIKPSKINAILISHWHGDHVLGLPGLLQTINASDYEKKMLIFGPSGTKNYFEHMFKAFSFNIAFEHEIIELAEEEIMLKEMKIEIKKLEHGVPMLGFAITEKDKRRIKPIAIKNLGIPEGPLLGELQNNKSITWKGEKISPKDTTYVVKGKKIAIILDTVLCENAYVLAKDSDLLICEASYTSDLEKKAEEYLHLTAKQAGQIASMSNVKQLVLTHLSQRYKTPEETLQDAKMVFDNTKVAFDFMKLKI